MQEREFNWLSDSSSFGVRNQLIAIDSALLQGYSKCGILPLSWVVLAIGRLKVGAVLGMGMDMNALIAAIKLSLRLR